jgi:Lysyl oxidase/Bacterial Ig domain
MARSMSLRVPRVAITALFGLLVVLLVCLLAMTSAARAVVTDKLPNLVADPATNPALQTYAYPDGTTHLLLRFDGYIHNKGPGAMEMRGSQRVGTTMTQTAQRIYRTDGSFYDDTSRHADIVWEPADTHNHWHLKAAARYSLWDSTKSFEVAPAMKVGFCAGDVEYVEGPDNAYYTYAISGICAQGQPTASSTFMGVGAGWRDRYSASTAFQWVDVTDVQPGTYWIRTEVDPQDYVKETDETNQPAFTTASSTVPGYRAKAVDAGVVSVSAPTTIPLATDSFGSGLGSRAFRIILSPKHGRLNVGGGSLFSTPSVTYTPNPGWMGPDSFTYEAHDSSSRFPPYPATAAITLNVGGVSPNVAISGAPASMQSGTSARLLAAVLGEDPYVYWTVDGVPPGTSTTGTVDAWGLYSAPAVAPPSGHVTIRATTASGAFSEVTIAITNPPAPQPAPAISPRSPANGGARPAGGRVLRGVKMGTDGKSAIVEARSRRAGMIWIRVHNRGRYLGRCRARIEPGRTVTCRTPLRGMWPGGTRAVITLRSRGKLVDALKTSLWESVARADLEGLHRK